MSNSQTIAAITAETLKPAIQAAAARAVQGVLPSAANTDALAEKVLAEVVPVVINQTNQEGPLASTVTWGAVVTIVAGLYGLGLDFADGTWPTPGELTTQLLPIAGGIAVIWGRWFQKKPLGA